MPLFLEVLTLGLILSADSFSAAIAMGGRKFTTRNLLTFAFASAGAETISSLIGYIAGAKFISLISSYDHWIAFGLLAAIACHMAYEGIQGLRGHESADSSDTFHSFAKILIVSFATSMDAFGVGIGLGLADKPIAPFLISIAFWAFTATVIGLFVGERLSKKFGPVFTLVAAAVLAYLSIEMLKI